jgi:hypothetical protein
MSFIICWAANSISTCPPAIVKSPRSSNGSGNCGSAGFLTGSANGRYITWNELTGDMLVSRAEINQMANPQMANPDRQETHGEETTLEPSAVTVTNP